jgi:small subunit ribosomal protein S16
MALKIRLRRMGRKKAPHYRIVVAESSMPRDGRFVQTVGHYNPRTEPMTLVVDGDRAREWMTKGARPTETVDKLFKRAGIYEGASGRPEPVAKVVETAREVGGKVAKGASKAAAAVSGAVAAATETVKDSVEEVVEAAREAVAGDDAETPAAESADAPAAEAAPAEEPAAEAPVAEAPAEVEPAAEEPASEEEKKD